MPPHRKSFYFPIGVQDRVLSSNLVFIGLLGVLLGYFAPAKVASTAHRAHVL